MSLFASMTLIDRYLAVTRHISIWRGKLWHNGRFTTIPNNANDLSAARTRIGKLLPGIRKCMLMAVVETNLWFFGVLCMWRCLYYIDALYNVLYDNDIFFSCAFFEWDSMLCSGDEDLSWKRVTYVDWWFNVHRIEQTNAHGQFFLSTVENLGLAPKVGKMPNVPQDFHKFMKYNCEKCD